MVRRTESRRRESSGQRTSALEGAAGTLKSQQGLPPVGHKNKLKIQFVTGEMDWVACVDNERNCTTTNIEDRAEARPMHTRKPVINPKLEHGMCVRAGMDQRETYTRQPKGRAATSC